MLEGGHIRGLLFLLSTFDSYSKQNRNTNQPTRATQEIAYSQQLTTNLLKFSSCATLCGSTSHFNQRVNIWNSFISVSLLECHSIYSYMIFPPSIYLYSSFSSFCSGVFFFSILMRLILTGGLCIK